MSLQPPHVPQSHLPSAKEKKFDRQIRLWGLLGQKALEDAHILLLNNGSGVVGTETLKNLILPSIGSFTIVDDRPVQEPDLGVNFFLEETSLGKSRAEETCKFLKELNPSVNGYAVNMDATRFLVTQDLSKFTLIVLTAPASITNVVQKLSDAAWEHQIPLFWVQCHGFYSCFSVQLPEYFPIVETHPDPATTQDLRLLEPWPELTEYVNKRTTGLDQMADKEHGHIPYLVLLLYYLGIWKAKNAEYPSTYAQKRAFRDMVQAGARTNNPEGGEENFDEAVSAVLKSVGQANLPNSLREVFEEKECFFPNKDSSNFFIIAHAIWRFHSETGGLPLPGGIPDMKAESDDYSILRDIYRAKSQADLRTVSKIVRAKEDELSRQTRIDDYEIELFCKNAAWVKLLHGRRIALPRLTPDGITAVKAPWDPYDGAQARVARELMDDTSKMPVYLAMLGFAVVFDEEEAWARSRRGAPFHTFSSETENWWEEEANKQHTVWDPLESPTNAFDRIAQGENMLPNPNRAEIDDGIGTRKYGDIDYMDRLVRAAALETVGKSVIPEDAEEREPIVARISAAVREIARSGPGELHNIASLTGGLVAQEIIKVVTRQYTPFNNVCVFDGVKSESQVWQL